MARARQARPCVVLVALLFSLGGVLAGALVAPGSVIGSDALPSCRYDDVATPRASYDEWQTTLVDTILRLPASYVPPDLVSVSVAGIGGAGSVRSLVIDDLGAMTRAAKAAGNPIAVVSAYRSFASQADVLQQWIGAAGDASAIVHAARPGHSEHQLGLAIDFRSAGRGPLTDGDWGQTPAGAWMRGHAWQFGFIQSYPKGQQSKSCYAYEAWHFRYVGRDLAASVHRSGLTLREFLWTRYTDAVGQPGATGRPTRTGPPDVASTVPFGAASPMPTADPTATAVTDRSPHPTIGPLATPAGPPRALGGTGGSLSGAVLLQPDWRPPIGLVLVLTVAVSTRGRRAADGP